MEKEQNRGLMPEIAQIKSKFTSALDWGDLYQGTTGSGVMQFAWRDAAAVVLFMSTVHTGAERISRNRKRPSGKSKRLTEPWLGLVVALLAIPGFIDDYNRTMNAVDLADQVRIAFESRRQTRRNWRPLWSWILDTTVGNCAYIWHSLGRFKGAKSHDSLHGTFRRQLAQELMKNHHSSPMLSRKTETDLVVSGIQNTPCLYGKQTVHTTCRACSFLKRKSEKLQPRRPLGEITVNRTVKQRTPRTIYICVTCGNMPLCERAACRDAGIN
jgi:hypothetical protein